MSVFLTEQLRAIWMLRFIPALCYVEKIAVDNYFSPRNMICRFGVYLDKKYHSNDYAEAFVDFYDWTKDIGRKLSDFSKLSPIWLTQPDRKHEVRTVQEWNGEPFPEEVYVDAGKMDMTGYIRWEEGQQKLFYDEAKLFLFE